MIDQVAGSPFRDQIAREFCQQPVRLEVPEIDGDGDEHRYGTCGETAVATCPLCKRLVCGRHRRSDGERCPGCAADDDVAAAAAADAEARQSTAAAMRGGAVFERLGMGMMFAGVIALDESLPVWLVALLFVGGFSILVAGARRRELRPESGRRRRR